MKHYESTLAEITNQVWAAKTAEEAKSAIVNYLETKRVKDKVKMISTVSALKSLTKVQFYFANALLKFEGMGVGENKSTEKVAKVETA